MIHRIRYSEKTNEELIKDLEIKKTEAVSSDNFEEAIKIRDQIEKLRFKGTPIDQKIDINQDLDYKKLQMDKENEKNNQDKERKKQIFFLNLEDSIHSKINARELLNIANQAIDDGSIHLNDKGEIENVVINKEGRMVDSALFGLARDRFGTDSAIIYRLQARSSNFKRWFGDWQKDPKNSSKVVDKNGEPWMVFHGGKRKFYEFKTGLNSQGGGSFGVFTTSHKEIAETYAKEKGDSDVDVAEPTLYSLFAVIKNPIIFQDKIELESKIKELGGGGFHDRDALQKAASILKQSYDGLYIKETDGYDQIMSFDTKNLKSIENIGTFSSSDAKMAS